ncbi:MAG: DUF1554 domain-containing protein [Leptospira sp.]|nr:DUF1554 domain-containing protein [Leptospira sp.]
MKKLTLTFLFLILTFIGCPKPENGTSPEILLPLLPGIASPQSLVVTYPTNTFRFQVNSAISPVSPTLSATATSCTISPTLPNGLSLNSTTCAITGTPTNMQPSASYTITASNSESSGQTKIGIAVSCATCRIFITSTAYSGNLGGASGADAKCNADGARPSTTSTYKAMVTDATRRACTTVDCSGGISENLDWVFYPNKMYHRADGTTQVMTTNSAGISTFPLNTGFASGAANSHWTGMNNTWTSSANNCNNWTNSSSGNGNIGINNNASTFAIFNSSPSCNQPSVFLACVEQ